MLNCALEAAIDLASPELHPVAKYAKDAAAGAVLMAALISVGVGVWLLGPPLWKLSLLGAKMQLEALKMVFQKL